MANQINAIQSQTAALCCVARNENRYLKEWVDYHLGIGFSRIYIYDVGDAGDERCDSLDLGENVYVVNSFRGRRKRGNVIVDAYKKCYAEIGGSVKWIMYLGVNEFFALEKHSCVSDFLLDFIKSKGAVQCIHFNCRSYGSGGAEKYEDRPVRERFTAPSGNESYDKRYRSIYRTKIRSMEFVGHYCARNLHFTYNSDGSHCGNWILPTTRTVTYEGGHVDWYVTKSREEYAESGNRSPLYGNGLGMNFYNEFNHCENKTIETCEKSQNASDTAGNTDNTIDAILKNNNDKIIVSLTSWRKRIQCVPHVIDLMKKQTLPPYKIILNLSTDEFPGKEKDIPNEIVHAQDDVFTIHWVKENTKVYKKVLPTLKRFPNDIIVNIDDDIEYPLFFIEKLYRKFIKHQRQLPVTSGTYKWGGDIYSHYGCFSMFTKDMFGKYLDDLYENVVLKHGFDTIPFQDPIFTYAILLNNKRYVYTEDMNMSTVRKNSPLDRINPLSQLDAAYRQKMTQEHEIIREYIENKYHKKYSDLIKTPIHVNITTWTQRDWCLPYMLKNLQKQTLHPDKIILWLSKEEYNKNKLPQHIKQCIDEKLLDEIMWVDKNTYCHKRHECFKYFNHCYNITMDDDILYPPTFISELVNAAKKHPDAVTCYWGSMMDYNGIKNISKNAFIGESLTNNFMGGCNCFPPYVYPMGAFTLNDLRDKYVTKCDEGWLKAWFIKNNIPINVIHQWNNAQVEMVGNSQTTAVWNENKQRYKNGMREKERNFFNAIKIVGVEQQVKKIWSNISIDTWELKTKEDLQ